MAEARKEATTLALEKEVPRAALDGVLTIEVDSRVESLEEQEDARWHQLLNAHPEFCLLKAFSADFASYHRNTVLR